MHEQDFAIVKGLVSVAWADGVFAEQEREGLDAVLAAYGATEKERNALCAYAECRRTLDDIDPQELSAGDRRVLLEHAVLLAFADGDPSKKESEFISALAAKLRIPENEAESLVGAGAARAKAALHLL